MLGVEAVAGDTTFPVQARRVKTVNTEPTGKTVGMATYRYRLRRGTGFGTRRSSRMSGRLNVQSVTSMAERVWETGVI